MALHFVRAPDLSAVFPASWYQEGQAVIEMAIEKVSRTS
jgi:hypothetical protein